ncbi:MAG: phosphatase PAP2 family protein [Chitinivibrionales bacterium]
MLEWILALDESLFLFFNSTIHNRIFDAWFVAVTNGRFWIIPGVVIGAAYLKNGKKQAAINIVLIIVAMSLSDLLGHRVLKPLFGRLRPCHPDFLIEGARYLIGHKRTLSFPSNHAMNSFAVSSMLILLHPRHFGWFLFVGGSVAFSRVYVGVHYPLDIFVGAIVGSGVGIGVYYTCKCICIKVQQNRRIKRQGSGD